MKFPEERVPIIVNPKIANIKYCAGPNFNEIIDKGGAIKSSAKPLTIPPKTEANVETLIAVLNLPCLVKTYPSKAVAAEAEVPGAFINIAGNEPPYIAEVYTLTSNNSAEVGSSPYVTGSNNATPRFAVRPGNIPIIKPITTPKIIEKLLPTVNKFERTSKLSIIYPKNSLFINETFNPNSKTKYIDKNNINVPNK